MNGYWVIAIQWYTIQQWKEWTVDTHNNPISVKNYYAEKRSQKKSDRKQDDYNGEVIGTEGRITKVQEKTFENDMFLILTGGDGFTGV